MNKERLRTVSIAGGYYHLKTKKGKQSLMPFSHFMNCHGQQFTKTTFKIEKN